MNLQLPSGSQAYRLYATHWTELVSLQIIGTYTVRPIEPYNNQLYRCNMLEILDVYFHNKSQCIYIGNDVIPKYFEAS